MIQILRKHENTYMLIAQYFLCVTCPLPPFYEKYIVFDCLSYLKNLYKYYFL
jgi:hypothetical protein